MGTYYNVSIMLGSFSSHCKRFPNSAMLGVHLAFKILSKSIACRLSCHNTGKRKGFQVKYSAKILLTLLEYQGSDSCPTYNLEYPNWCNNCHISCLPHLCQEKRCETPGCLPIRTHQQDTAGDPDAKIIEGVCLKMRRTKKGLQNKPAAPGRH